MLGPAKHQSQSENVNSAVRKFGETYEKRYGEVPGVIAVANYAAFDVFTQAMQRAGSVETDRVLEVLTKERFETVWGPLVIGGKETYGIDRQFLYPLVISEVRAGKIVDVAQVVPAALKKSADPSAGAAVLLRPPSSIDLLCRRRSTASDWPWSTFLSRSA